MAEHTFRLAYKDDDPFDLDLQDRVEGLLADGFAAARAIQWVRLFVVVGGYWLVWFALAWQGHSLLVTVALLLALSVLTLVLAFCVAHDAVHGSFAANSKLDRAIYSLALNSIGPNAYLWRIRHNDAHHFCPNVPGGDHDIEASEALRLSPKQPVKKMHRFQHLYASLAYSLFTLHWIFVKDFQVYFAKDFGIVANLKHSPWRFVEMILWKAAYIGYAIVLPWQWTGYSLGTVLLAFLCFHLFLAWWVTLFIVASHLSTDAKMVLASDEGDIGHGYLRHQVLTAIDFHPESRLVNFVFGGFNTHVAHHCFPGVPSTAYPALTVVIRQACRDHGLEYRQLAIPRLFARHFAYLKAMGRGAG